MRNPTKQPKQTPARTVEAEKTRKEEKRKRENATNSGENRNKFSAGSKKKREDEEGTKIPKEENPKRTR